MATPDPFTGLFWSSWSLRAFSDFSFSGQPRSHLIWFGVAIAFACLSVAAAAIACLDKRGSNRFLWAFGSLFGFGKIALVWTGGEPDIYTISVQIPVAILTRTPQHGWVLFSAVPIVAIVYLSRRYRYAKGNEHQHS